MAMTVGALARLVDGALHGDPDLQINDAAPIEAAGPGSITFLSDPKKALQLTNCKASAVFVGSAVPAAVPHWPLAVDGWLRRRQAD